MPIVERDESPERDAVIKHQNSFPEFGKIHIPMWDSSDPDRAPPPLPLNPGSPHLSVRPNASATIAAAAKALEEKARESAPASAYTVNPMPQKSPERSLIKGAQHKRMQSFQNASVRDLRSYLDGTRTPERSPERPVGRSGTPNFSKDFERDFMPGSPEKSPGRMVTPTPAGRDLLKESAVLRPSSRATHKAILGENTPPSATMLALQTMPIREFEVPPLANVTNTATPTKTPPNLDALANQLHSITTIATNLQREMAQLSRRSKDNAGDLVSLKEATQARDEDIRKSLKDLVKSISSGIPHQPPPPPPFLGHSPVFNRSTPNLRAEHNESKDPNSTPPMMNRTFTMPHVPSPGNFFVDERIGSPNPYSVEGAASVAMLEKIIREMVTKEGQERLLGTLSKLLDKASQDSGETSKKVTELVDFIKGAGHGGFPPNGAQPRATSSGSDGTGPLVRTSRDMFTSLGDNEIPRPFSSPKAADFVSAEMLNLLKKIKDSVTESGGLTAEVKALVRDLRSEVLGMGRELARKIDEHDKFRGDHLAIEDSSGRQDVGRIVQEGLEELKTHMDHVMREKRRQSSSSTLSRMTVDSQEVYNVVKNSLVERQPSTHADVGLDREAILDAVREAYESYKPEIELQQFGLERDEILQCLKEGLEDYQAAKTTQAGISKEEIMGTIQEAMKTFTPPPPINESREIRDEVLAVVRECIEEVKPNNEVTAIARISEDDITREYVMEAIKEGLAIHGSNGPRELEINRDDLLDAVKAGLEGSQIGGVGDQVIKSLHEIVENMRDEFKSYSSANGRDTEQVLDAVKDGLESLRAGIESYVDKAQDVTGKDEIINTIKDELARLDVNVKEYISEPDTKMDILVYLKAEFEHLHESMNSQLVPHSSDKEELLTALNAGFQSLKTQVGERGLNAESQDDISEAMKDEFEQIKSVILNRTETDKDETLNVLRGGFDSVLNKLDQSSQSEHVLASLKEEFEHLRETLAASLIRSGGTEGKEDIIDAVREQMDSLRAHITTSSQADASTDSLATIRKEVEQLREMLGSSLVPSGSNANTEELSELLKVGLNDIRTSLDRPEARGMGEETLASMRAEFEHLRQSIATNLAHTSSRADTEEVLDTVRLGLDDLRSHLEKRIDNPERHMSATSEIVDALNDGLDSLRSDVSKMVEKPVDDNISHEILATLKEGLAALRADMDRLKGEFKADIHADIHAEIPVEEIPAEDIPVEDVVEAVVEHEQHQEQEETRSVAAPDDTVPTGQEMVLADDLAVQQTRDLPIHTGSAEVTEVARRDDFSKLEDMLSQLHLKMEAMDAHIQEPRVEAQRAESPTPTSIPDPSPPVESTIKEDLLGIEQLLKELQDSVNLVIIADKPDLEAVARKEDTDAIETLLRNTKAQLDDLAFPDPTTLPTKETVDTIETLTKTVFDSVEAFSARVEENVASKGDVAVVEVLVGDIKTIVEEMKEASKPSEEEQAEKVTKTDVDVLGVLCTDIKAKLEQMDSETLPSKSDVEQLIGLIHDFRESHDKLKDSYETDIAVTAKAFDDRKQEAAELSVNIVDLKAALEDVREDIKTKLQEDGQSVHNLVDTVKGLEDTIGSNFSISGDVKELIEIVNREFERAQGSIDGLKSEMDDNSAASLEKHDESKAAIITDLSQTITERFDILMAKYDDAQLLADAQTKAMEDKGAKQEELLTQAQTMSEELKLTIDTLGTSITELGGSMAELGTTFTETNEKLSNDSQTVFDRIDDMANKVTESHDEAREDHRLTREQVVSTLTAITSLQSEVTETHPRFMGTLSEILTLVTQHYEQSNKAQEATQEHVRAISEESRTHLQELKIGFAALPALLAPPPAAIKDVETEDESPKLEEKLDRLLNHADESKESIAKLSQLEKIHDQIMATAAQVSDFVAKQTILITEGHENKEKEAEEIALVLERRIAQKEQIENDIHNFNHEKDTLRAEVEALQAERDSLSSQKSRLAADVSSLQTALDIRREELQVMDAKADALERRILEGIMDHSRALLMSKTNRNPTKSKSKRVTSNATQDNGVSAPTQSPATNGLTMALKPRMVQRRNPNQPNTGSRRILSLSQISSNVPTGAQAYTPAPMATNTALGGLKRSHSVKNSNVRKVSWGALKKLNETNKENEALSEESDGEQQYDDRSEVGTERRHSYGTGTSAYSESYATESVADTDRRKSYGVTDSERSYLTGSDADRRTSYGSTRRSTMGEGTIDEEGSEEDESEESGSEEESDEEAEGQSVTGEIAGQRTVVGADGEKHAVVVYAPPSDSGLGSELQSAVGNSEVGYFQRAIEDKKHVAA